jgi:RNA polymerase sigma-70 factor (ECF subfamily)
MSCHELEFCQIHETFRPQIHRYLARMVGEPEAEDLTQEVFVKVNQALRDFRGESKLSTWLYRIATNAALDRLRSPSFQRIAQQRSVEGSTEPGEGFSEDRDSCIGQMAPSVEQQLVRKEMNDCIRDFVARLPENYRAVLVLSEFEGLKNAEISEILGITLDTVKIRLHRARKRLKEELETHCDPYWLVENEFAPDLLTRSR